jgi:hypothetical protein
VKVVTRAGSQQWRLYVDEAGQFNNPSDEVTCAGLLVRRDISGSSPEEIRVALRNAAPELNWPLHSAHFGRPVLFALAAHARGKAIVTATLGDGSAAIIAELRSADPDTTDRALTDLVARREPKLSDIGRLDRLFRDLNPPGHMALRERVKELQTILRRLIRSLATAASSGEGATAYTFAASERQVASERGTNGGRAYPSRRYDAVLFTLLRSVVRSLAHHGGVHHVFVQVLTRSTLDPVLDRDVPFHLRHLAALIAGLQPNTSDVRLLPEATPRFDEEVHPALVLADYVASKSRPILARGELARVEQALVDRFAAAPRSGVPARTHLAAADSLELRPGEPKAPSKPWPRDADREWA